MYLLLPRARVDFRVSLGSRPSEQDPREISLLRFSDVFFFSLRIRINFVFMLPAFNFEASRSNKNKPKGEATERDTRAKTKIIIVLRWTLSITEKSREIKNDSQVCIGRIQRKGHFLLIISIN